MQRIELVSLSKRFGETQALKDASFSACQGEVVAICGENGAGKSTLMSLLAGSRRPTSGHIEIDGEPVEIETPHEAFDLGIHTVYQELSLLADLSVAENLFLGELPLNRFGAVDWRRLHAQAADEIRAMGLTEVDTRRRTGSYAVATQQMFEIAKAIRNRPELLILDEPTGVLTQTETDLLFAKIKELTGQGTIVFYISHRLEEVLEIADRLVILKDGETVDTMTRQDADKDRLIRSMVGRPLEAIFPERRPHHDDVLMRVEGLSGIGIDNVSFELRKGEILGFCGLVRSGRTELMRALFGAAPHSHGTIEVCGRTLTGHSPKQAMKVGLGFVTEERKLDGLALDADVQDNAGLTSMDRVSAGPFIRRNAQRVLVQEMVSKMDVRPDDLRFILRRMSGGNQQKVILAKWLLMRGLKILILDEPTRGVDIATKVEIYKLIADLAAEGIGIVMVSSEMPEVLGLAHRILVMNSGTIAAEFAAEEADEHRIFVAAAGVEGHAA